MQNLVIADKKTSGEVASLVKDFYTANASNEWKRLVRDAYHRLEFETTAYFLEKYLPPAPKSGSGGLDLDAGGGPGRYTIWLAQHGYEPILLDLTPANLALARRRIKRAGLQPRVKDVIEGSILDLSRFDDAVFDAVLCTGGPLSHVLDPRLREKAISELVRVAKPGAPIFVSVISRLAVISFELIAAQEEFEMPLFKPLRDCGDYFGGHGFTACHFFLPEELHQAFEHQPVEILEMAGLEGLATHHPKQLNQLSRNPTRWAIWLETHLQTCTHPSVVGISGHMLIVSRKL